MARTTAKALAKLFSCSEAEIRQLEKDGILPPATGRAYETVPAIQGYVAWLRSMVPPEKLAAPKRGMVVESLKQAADAIGTDAKLIQRARALGCPGFLKFGRVNVSVVAQWLRTNADKVRGAATRKEELELEKLRQQCRALAFDNDVKEGHFLKTSEVDQGITRMVAAFSMALDRVAAGLAPEVVGATTPAQAETIIRKALARARDTLHKRKWRDSS